MTDLDEKHGPDRATSGDEGAPSNPSRRRFAQIGGALVPTILTLSSRPTWATGGVQCLSARMSGNLSRPATFECAPGRPPRHWAMNPTRWPAPTSFGTLRRGRTVGSTDPSHYSGGTRFGDIFPTSTSAVRDTPLRLLFNDTSNVIESNFAAAMLSAFADAANYSPDAMWLRRAFDDPSVFRGGSTQQDIVVSVLLPTFV